MSDVKVVWVQAVSPSLTVREAAGATPVAARLVGGSGFTPVVDGPVLAVFVHGRYYVLGGA